MDLTSKAKATKAKVSKWDYIQLKGIYIAMKTISKMTRQPKN